MQTTHQPPNPDTDQDLADALAAVDVTAAPGFDPALARRGWLALKQARGQTVDLHHLPPAHVMAPAAGWPPMPADATCAEITQRALLRTVHLLRHKGIIPRSDREAAAQHTTQAPLGGAA